MFDGLNDIILDRLFSDIAKINSRQDCYWYSEWHDMGAIVPQCTLAEMGKCPCKNCENFLDKEEARNVVMRYFVEKKKKNEMCCLLCPNSFSEPATDESGNDILHCVMKNGEIVNPNDFCEEYN